MTRLAVAVEPVKAILRTLGSAASAAPVSPRPVTVWNTSCSGTDSLNSSASRTPMPGVSSLGLNTTALPAASA